ncbi:MAG: hypothetical protein LBE91_08230 [Tannerella sp.]|jgi:hypothetical protein|nr:hypothetical protein [Tannerella sp.]
MTKAEKYIKKHPELELFLIPKKFGNGKQLITFHYRDQINLHKQGFLAYVDSHGWRNDRYDEMERVQQYMETEQYMEDAGLNHSGIFTEDDYNEYFESEITDGYTPDGYLEWHKKQFPGADLTYGGVCYFGKV